MKRRYAVAALGLIAALALTSSALGGPSLNSLIKNEVAKQLSVAHVSKKKGKRGPPGPPGPPGANGTNGTARAYGYVNWLTCSGAPPLTCSLDRAKGVSSITETSSTSGVYCVNAPGLDSETSPAVATVEYTESTPANIVTWSRTTTCSAGQYEFRTITTAGAQVSNVAFSFVIP